jgi:GT2 family glycosyltransferase
MTLGHALNQGHLHNSTLPTCLVKSNVKHAGARPCALGKFIHVGHDKLYIRGVTYGPFRPDESGSEYHQPEDVDRDFALMAANGINAVRTYTVPPHWLLDIAGRHGLRVMVGIPWEQHITFLDDRERIRTIEAKVRSSVRACGGHPAILCYAIGNEIPAPIVRWHGRRRVEKFLERLCAAAKAEDPDGLVTYVNYPTTEFLRLPFLDLVCFNVYLEAQERLESYLARLQNLAGDRPLIMGEIGLDSRRNGPEAQAGALDWQIRTAFAAGGSGVFAFSWTDEWHRGGYDIEDWDFGLLTRDRRPKPALEAVRKAFAEVPFPADLPWPRISVVVCSRNGGRTLSDTCEGLRNLAYPDYEVILVNDGSTDNTEAIACQNGVRVITTENRGLSSARNTGMEAATGDIIAYIDDDARPDSHWLTYLAATLLRSDHAGVGGPNLAPPGDGLLADCVACAPGGPNHVLLSDRIAEHIPGCNMAFWKSHLRAVGGFDTRFRIAGDDVDVCWRLQQRGWTLGFSPAAMVWHHRRNSVKSYWKQQLNYGKAEAMLAAEWPQKYNSAGHPAWQGRVYGGGMTRPLILRGSRVYHGVWGSRLFQSMYEGTPGILSSLSLMPEWYLLIAGLAVLSALGLHWSPLLVALPLLILAFGILVVQAVLSASTSRFPSSPRTSIERLRAVGLTACLHLLQPFARLSGRLRLGLAPWRRLGKPHFAFPTPQTRSFWSEYWRAPERRLETIETALLDQGIRVMRGGDCDRWDLQVPGGLWGAARGRMTVEEHGGGKQMARFRSWPLIKRRGWLLLTLFAGLAIAAAIVQAWPEAVLMGLAAIVMAAKVFTDCGAAMAAWVAALQVSSGGVSYLKREAARATLDRLPETRAATP